MKIKKHVKQKFSLILVLILIISTIPSATVRTYADAELFSSFNFHHKFFESVF